MRIPVIFTGGNIGQIHRHTLDHLIEQHDIVAFRRSTGWVQVGRDPVRRGQEPFTGPRRRWSDSLPQVPLTFSLPSR